MTDSELRYLIDAHRISIEYGIECRAFVDVPTPLFAWGATVTDAVTRLANKAGWLTTPAAPLFTEHPKEDA